MTSSSSNELPWPSWCPDPTPEAREAYDKDIEAIAMRIARNFEIDHYQARVFDVSSPHLARGYDLESHRANGDKVVIEVKGRAGRGAVQLDRQRVADRCERPGQVLAVRGCGLRH